MESQPLTARPGSRPRVLVLDDDVVIGAMVSEVLRDTGYQPLAARSIEEVDQDVEVSCVLLDLIPVRVYSRSVAVEWIEELRSRWPDVPMLLLTAHSEALKDAEAFAPVRVMGKPFAIDALAQAVGDLLYGSARAVP
ncbi:MAG TPA: hypothetical protein VNB06_06930 [Thermoanaerobaculia bacterium]|nr:hypothetical protein [Thermoanaerobaculia bacterium]